MSALADPSAVTPPAAPAADRAPEWVAGGTPEPLRSGLEGALGSDRVLSSALDLVKYASDASPYRLMPQAVAMPHSVGDVVALLRWAQRSGTPITFRAAGTSLNGQAQSDSVLVDVRRHFSDAEVLDGGARVRVSPGIVLGHVNRLLRRYGRKLGPDPASTEIACVGGVIANNSGGMRCGVHADSYQTVSAMKLVLAGGALIDTAAPDAGRRFARVAPELAVGLEQIRDELRADTELAERVRRKFAIKNTTGYRLCAFLDADEPLEVSLRNLKSTPEVEETVTKCIECGFCEPVCPSRNVTTTPRQRIVIRREMARQAAGSPVYQALEDQFGYEGIDTCAADGSCMHACPVGIDTGKLIKALRSERRGQRSEQAGVQAAIRFGGLERATGAGLRIGSRAARPSIPPAAPALPGTSRRGAAAAYMPACINRMFGNPAGTESHPSVPEALVALSARAGAPVWIPDDVVGLCCGTPWTSKGFAGGHARMAERVAGALLRWSEAGKLPVVIDATSCAQGLITEVAAEGVQVLDSIAWVHDHLLPRLPIRRRLGTVAIHPTCASQHLGLSGQLAAIAAAIADEVVVPAGSGCCGMAGDQGWIHPELPASALRDVARELDGRQLDACLSSNRTCEAALQQITGRPYASFLLALEEVTR